jgi:predicted dehydrogenase
MKPPDRPLGVAVVGLGVGEQHVRAYAASNVCRLNWLYDLDPAKAQRLAREFGNARVARSFDEITADRATDIVSIASYDDAHAAQVIAALQARKHVFVEKPLCRTDEELRAVFQAWESNGRPHLTSNLVLRGAPLYEWLQQRVAAGELGRIYAFDAEYLYGRLAKITQGWRGDVNHYSVMQGGGIHLVDLMLQLTNERPYAASAVGNRICTEGTRFSYPDYVAATYRFPSGLIGRVTANFGCVLHHQHVVRIFGTHATFFYDDAGARLYRFRDPGGPVERPEQPPQAAGKGVLIPRFIDAIRAGASSEPGAVSEFHLMSACLGADRALAEGREAAILPLDFK